jgi:hypothetical protein
MDASRFDRLTRAISHATLPRRQILIALVLGIVGLHARGGAVAAGPGCKNVGKKCKKKKDCCSGICKGKKGKKRCKAHDTGGCQAGQRQGICGGVDVPCTTSAGNPGLCQTTTGNAAYCTAGGGCFACQQDADCRPFCGPGAACVRCLFCGEDGSPTACVGLIPGGCEFPP